MSVEIHHASNLRSELGTGVAMLQNAQLWRMSVLSTSYILRTQRHNTLWVQVPHARLTWSKWVQMSLSRHICKHVRLHCIVLCTRTLLAQKQIFDDQKQIWQLRQLEVLDRFLERQLDGVTLNALPDASPVTWISVLWIWASFMLSWCYEPGIIGYNLI